MYLHQNEIGNNNSMLDIKPTTLRSLYSRSSHGVPPLLPIVPNQMALPKREISCTATSVRGVGSFSREDRENDGIGAMPNPNYVGNQMATPYSGYSSNTMPPQQIYSQQPEFGNNYSMLGDKPTTSPSSYSSSPPGISGFRPIRPIPLLPILPDRIDRPNRENDYIGPKPKLATAPNEYAEWCRKKYLQ